MVGWVDGQKKKKVEACAGGRASKCIPRSHPSGVVRALLRSFQRPISPCISSNPFEINSTSMEQIHCFFVVRTQNTPQLSACIYPPIRPILAIQFAPIQTDYAVLYKQAGTRYIVDIEKLLVPIQIQWYH